MSKYVLYIGGMNVSAVFVNSKSDLLLLAYIPPHLRGGGGSNQRPADSYQDNYHGGRGGGRGNKITF